MTEPEILTTIKDHMKSAAITHEMAAELSGLKQGNISRLLSGKYSPNLKTLLRLADAIQIEIKAENYAPNHAPNTPEQFPKTPKNHQPQPPTKTPKPQHPPPKPQNPQPPPNPPRQFVIERSSVRLRWAAPFLIASFLITSRRPTARNAGWMCWLRQNGWMRTNLTQPFFALELKLSKDHSRAMKLASVIVSTTFTSLVAKRYRFDITPITTVDPASTSSKR